MQTARSSLTPTPLQILERGAQPSEPCPLDEVSVERATVLKEKRVDLTFGTVFTDHMLLADYEPERGWYSPRIRPYGALLLDPATAALHYGQSVFEGLKAFRVNDGAVRVFRPERHLRRLVSSAERLCMPAPEPERALAWLLELLRLERDWTPEAPGTSLYIRPVIMAREPFLGVRPSLTYTFFVILSPVGAYYESGMKPMRLRVVDRYVRAVDGGVGASKNGGNYAAALLAAQEAQAAGFDQVLWLDGVQRRYLDEAGTMNVMLRIGETVVTPPLTGTLLDGVTRDTALTLLREWDVDVQERPIAIDEVVAAAREGTLREVWGTGTAAAIQPIAELSYKGERLVASDGGVEELTVRLAQAIADVQYGRAEDRWGWLTEVL
jgi:branched-chain amino acid aminotransferase